MDAQKVNQSILHEYPYPIAKCYERLLRARSASERCEQSRYLFEVTLRYCACLAIADYLRATEPNEAMKETFKCLIRPSLGQWAGLLRQCLQETPESMFPELLAAWFQKKRDARAMIDAICEIRTFSDGRVRSPQQTASAITFADAMVTYRNRTVGHGAPQLEHAEKFAPVLEAGVLDFLLQLNVLTRLDLAFVSEIKVERGRFVHNLIGLKGTTQVSLHDYITSQDNAQLDSDRTLVLIEPNELRPILSLHPFIVYVEGSVFLLENSDFNRSVNYISYNSGAAYSADNTYADFRQRLGENFDSTDLNRSDLRAEELYQACLSVSLSDGIVSDEERVVLDDLAKQLGLSYDRVNELESSSIDSSQGALLETADLEPVSNTDSSSITDVAMADLPSLIDQQTTLLQELGQIVLTLLSHRPDPATPMSLQDIRENVNRVASQHFGDITTPQLARLLKDIQNHGFSPGLTKTGTGYAVLEDHFISKLARDHELKQELAQFAVNLIQPGMSIGLDGGSTTLPIAREIVLALDAEALWDLTVVTNSLPVVQELADLVEHRGWSDEIAPVQILICSGRIRAMTKAIAETKDGSRLTQDSLARIFTGTGGLDYCFVGANGITADEGITIPTEIELATKKQFIEAARSPYIVADSNKIGVRHPVSLACWDARITLLTNSPEHENPELARILQLDRKVEILLSGEKTT